MASIQDYLQRATQRAYLSNLDTGEAKEFQFNPTELEEVHEGIWAMQEAQGMSHARAQYVRGVNVPLTVTTVFDQLVYDQRKAQQRTGIVDRKAQGRGLTDVEDWKYFLLALKEARRSDKLSAASPPPALFVWPGILSMRVRVRKVTLKHTMFYSGRPRIRIMVATIEMFEEPQDRIYSEDVRSSGTMRPGVFRGTKR